MLYDLFGDFVRYERIRNLREDSDYTQLKIAEYLCIKQATYSDYERGKINVPVEAFSKLADFYGTSVDYLLNRTDQKKPYPSK